MILNHLNDLRREIPECGAVALVDLTSGLVLCVSSGKGHPQERLDALSGAAVDFLGGRPQGSVASAPPAQAWLFSERDTCLFLRSRKDPSEALALVCSPAVSTETLLQAATQRLDIIADLN
jgi:hypothetical protein